MGVCWSDPGAPLVTRPECVTVLSGAPGWENSWGETGHRHRAPGTGVGFCVLCMSLVINSSGKLITMNKCTYLSYDVPNLFLDGKRSSVQHSMSIGFIILVSMDWHFPLMVRIVLKLNIDIWLKEVLKTHPPQRPDDMRSSAHYMVAPPHWSLCAGYTRHCPRPGSTCLVSLSSVHTCHSHRGPGQMSTLTQDGRDTCWCDLTPQPWTACTRSTGGDGQGPGRRPGRRTPSRASPTWASGRSMLMMATTWQGRRQTLVGCTGLWDTFPTSTR